MRLVLVHGINNQGNSSAAIARDWTAWMAEKLGKPHRFDGLEVVAPFYGDKLHELENSADPDRAIAQGIEAVAGDDEAALFLASGLQEIAMAAGITEAAIQRQVAAPEVVAQGVPPHDRYFIALIQLIEKLSPLHGDVAVKLLNQAYAYLRHDWVAEAVDAIVAPALPAGEELVVVAHSLGTVVTYKLLRQFAKEGQPRNVKLYVTMGSPLAIKAVQSALGKPREVPKTVARWLNARDPDDFVTLGYGLTDQTFCAGIDNINDVDNPGTDAHSIKGYLHNKPTVDAVSAALP